MGHNSEDRFSRLGVLILHSYFLDSYLDYESWGQLASADMQVCAAVGNTQQDVSTRISFKCSSRVYHGDSKSHAGTQIKLCRSRDQPEAHINLGVVKFSMRRHQAHWKLAARVDGASVDEDNCEAHMAAM